MITDHPFVPKLHHPGVCGWPYPLESATGPLQITLCEKTEADHQRTSTWRPCKDHQR